MFSQPRCFADCAGRCCAGRLSRPGAGAHHAL